ncbi:MAG: hypothetical protein LKF47_01255 [Megasphaera sp.]|jgi:DNA-directed RNA polymerase subunit RPC12/RpoP|nr:hypothetical protein [Megasphaera sp.]
MKTPKKCHDCGRAFRNNEKIIERTDRKTGKKLYVCENCFKKRSGLTFEQYGKTRLKIRRTILGAGILIIAIVTLVFLFH